MPFVANCPACEKLITIPRKSDPQSRVRCPLCEEEYLLDEALKNIPPQLQLLEVPQAAPASIGPADNRSATGTSSEPWKDSSTQQQPLGDQDESQSIDVEQFDDDEDEEDEGLELELEELPDAARPVVVTFDFDEDEMARGFGAAGQTETPFSVLDVPNMQHLTMRRNPWLTMVRQVLGVLFGGAIGLALGYYALLWIGGPRKDFLRLGEKIPAVILPASFDDPDEFLATQGTPQPLPSSNPKPNIINIGSAPHPINRPQLTASAANANQATNLNQLDRVGSRDKPETLAPADGGATDRILQPDSPASDNQPTPAEPMDESPAADDQLNSDPASRTVAPDSQSAIESQSTTPDQPSSDSVATESSTADRNDATANLDETASNTLHKPIAQPEIHAVGLQTNNRYDIHEMKLASTDAVTGSVDLNRLSLNVDTERMEKAGAYITLCRFAEVHTLFDGEIDDSLAESLNRIREVLVDSTKTDRKRSDLGRLASSWRGHKDRKVSGILIVGTVQEVTPVGALYAMKILLSGQNQEVTVLSDKEPPFKRSELGIVLGTIVNQPSVHIMGYDGDLPQAIWAGMAFNADTP